MVEAVNFLYFITDQHRADYLGCAGHPVLKTPNIDRIAGRGSRFDRFHVANPVCMPNRASLMTGRMTSVNGVRHNGIPLPLNSTTFVDVLRQNGWDTALIGKSHLQNFTDEAAPTGGNPAGDGPLSEARHDGGGDYSIEHPRHDALDSFNPPLPYYGFSHLDLVTRHGARTGGDHARWLRRKLNDPEAVRGPANQLPHDYTCPQAIRTALPEALYSTSYIRDQAVAYLRDPARAQAPFFNFVSFPDPHHPFTPPGRYWDLYKPEDMVLPGSFHAHENPPPHLKWLQERFAEGKGATSWTTAIMIDEIQARQAMALTCGMIAMIDDAVGALLDALEETGLAKNTVVVFNTDHGDFLGDHGMLLKGPLHFQGLIRAPFLWADPGRPSAPVVDALSSTIDVAPTILARAGITPFNGIQGRDLAGALAGAGTGRDALLIEDDANRAYLGFETAPRLRTLVTRRYRLSVYLDETWGEIYDLRADPLERHNLWDDAGHAATRDGLIRQLLHEVMRADDRSPWPTKTA